MVNPELENSLRNFIENDEAEDALQDFGSFLKGSEKDLEHDQEEAQERNDSCVHLGDILVFVGEMDKHVDHRVHTQDKQGKVGSKSVFVDDFF